MGISIFLSCWNTCAIGTSSCLPFKMPVRQRKQPLGVPERGRNKNLKLDETSQHLGLAANTVVTAVQVASGSILRVTKT